jgi:hypothetical protein
MFLLFIISWALGQLESYGCWKGPYQFKLCIYLTCLCESCWDGTSFNHLMGFGRELESNGCWKGPYRFKLCIYLTCLCESCWDGTLDKKKLSATTFPFSSSTDKYLTVYLHQLVPQCTSRLEPSLTILGALQSTWPHMLWPCLTKENSDFWYLNSL